MIVDDIVERLKNHTGLTEQVPQQPETEELPLPNTRAYDNLDAAIRKCTAENKFSAVGGFLAAYWEQANASLKQAKGDRAVAEAKRHAIDQFQGLQELMIACGKQDETTAAKLMDDLPVYRALDEVIKRYRKKPPLTKNAATLARVIDVVENPDEPAAASTRREALHFIMKTMAASVTPSLVEGMARQNTRRPRREQFDAEQVAGHAAGVAMGQVLINNLDEERNYADTLVGGMADALRKPIEEIVDWNLKQPRIGFQELIDEKLRDVVGSGSSSRGGSSRRGG